MLKSIMKFLTITLAIIILVLAYKVMDNIKIKKEIRKANTEFNEANEKYINKDEETEVVEYKSDTLHINIIPIKKTNPNIEMWEINIKLNDASQIKSAFAGGKFSLTKKERTSKITMRHNAVLAINGAARSYVIRDGIVYRDIRLDCDPLIIQNNGDFIIYDEQLTGEELVEKGAMHTYDFGPDLIRNGEIVDYGDTLYKESLDPRTVIGQKGHFEYVILVVDGRSKASVGMSHYDTAVELKNRGCYWGYNLDGGGSTNLYFNGEVLNNPSDIIERKISDILYFVD